MSNRWREWIERHLPWYSPRDERQRDVRSAVRLHRSKAEIDHAEGIIADYREAEKESARAGEAVIDEVRRANDERR